MFNGDESSSTLNSHIGNSQTFVICSAPFYFIFKLILAWTIPHIKRAPICPKSEKVCSLGLRPRRNNTNFKLILLFNFEKIIFSIRNRFVDGSIVLCFKYSRNKTKGVFINKNNNRSLY